MARPSYRASSFTMLSAAPALAVTGVFRGSRLIGGRSEGRSVTGLAPSSPWPVNLNRPGARHRRVACRRSAPDISVGAADRLEHNLRHDAPSDTARGAPTAVVWSPRIAVPNFAPAAPPKKRLPAVCMYDPAGYPDFLRHDGTRPVKAAGLRMTARRDGKTLRPALRPNVEFSELLPTVR